MFSPREFQPSNSAPVVFFGSVATDPAEWTWLAEYIGGDFKVIAPDVRLDNKATPNDWIAAVEDCFHREAMRAGCQINIVAHGSAAIPALRFASAKPELVRSIVLIEAMVVGRSSGVSEFRAMAKTFQSFCAEGDAAAASGWHTDYWHGKGAWVRTSANLRQSIASRTGATRRDIETILSSGVSDQQLAGVVCPVMLINGENTTVDAKSVASDLVRSIPFAVSHEVQAAGHVPHISDPHVTHPLIREFLVPIAQHWHDSAVQMLMAA